MVRRRFHRAWNRAFPNVPLPLRISPGVWWIARDDAISSRLFTGTSDLRERAVVRRILRPGMTVFDVGSNAGVYTLTAAKLVGPTGRVVAFEPSPRERARLATHVRLNRFANVTIEEAAAGATTGEVDLYMTDRVETGCNSLRPHNGFRADAVRVPMCTLDDYVARHGMSHVDFIKMDVEGGERDALVGAARLFARDRPALLCEIEPARIEPWGYEPVEIVDLVRSWGYDWFALDEPDLTPMPREAAWSGNFAAFPRSPIRR